MDDNRIPCRPLLGGKNPRHGGRIQGIRSQPINRLGGQRHQAPVAKNFRGAVERLLCFGTIEMPGAHSQSQCLHILIVACRGQDQRAPPALSAISRLRGFLALVCLAYVRLARN